MTTKFNVKFSDHTYRVVGELAGWTDSTMADVIRESLSMYWWLAKEYRQGSRLLVQRGDTVTELLIPSLEQLKDSPEGEAEVPQSSTDAPSDDPRRHSGRRPRST